ncbi:hypothetical protein [Gemmiger formicilis]|uniref:hypothetical protein n=1 Tax=Gemmiger formicilis TaxID=745368 RepID=UPI0009994548|nr:hypothetical protein [Gemmiger formicilis]
MLFRVSSCVLWLGVSFRVFRVSCSLLVSVLFLLVVVCAFAYALGRLEATCVVRVLRGVSGSMPLLGLCLWVRLLFAPGWSSGASGFLGLILVAVCALLAEFSVLAVSVPLIVWPALDFVLVG